jgi:hypothetical protein
MWIGKDYLGVFVGLVSTLFVACGEVAEEALVSSVETTVTTNGLDDRVLTTGQDTPESEKDRAPTPINQVVLYLSSSQDTSQFFSEIGATIESDEQFVFRYVPATEEKVLFDRNKSSSFAHSTVRVYTNNDRLFLRSHSGYDSNDHFSYTEYDLDSHQQKYTVTINDPVSEGCAAIVGDALYYRENSSFSAFSGNIGGDLKRLDEISTVFNAEGTVLVESNDLVNRCHFNLASVAGELYDVIKTEGQLEIWQRNRETAHLESQLGSVMLSDDADYRSLPYRFSFDSQWLYWTRTRKSDHTVELWRYDYHHSDLLGVEPEQRFSAVLGHVWDLDVDNGQVSILWLDDDTGNSQLVLFDDNREEVRRIDLGGRFYDMEILYRQTDTTSD